MKVFIQEKAIQNYTLLSKVLPLFPSGFPVTTEVPERDLAFYWNKSWLQKHLYKIHYFLKTGKVLQLSPEVDPPFYILDSKTLTVEQHQALLRLLKEKRWNGTIPSWVNPSDPVSNSIKILAKDVERTVEN